MMNNTVEVLIDIREIMTQPLPNKYDTERVQALDRAIEIIKRAGDVEGLRMKLKTTSMQTLYWVGADKHNISKDDQFKQCEATAKNISNHILGRDDE